MNKVYASFLVTLFFSSISFASSPNAIMGSTGGSTCSVLAKACMTGGYERNKAGKHFWKDCMHPLLLGQSVSGVSIDASKVKACRDKKIAELQQMLTELQAVK